MTSTSQPSLLRAVSRWQVVALSINDVIGSGVYLLPAAAAALLGPASVWAILAAGLCVLFIVLCFAEAGSMFDQPGGGYVYTREAFGELAGFEVCWMTWVARVTVAASLSAGFAQAVSGVWSGAAAGWGRAVLIVVPLLFLTAVNVAGVKHGARLAVLLVAGKLLPLLALVAAGALVADWSRVDFLVAPEAGNLGQASLLLLFAYAGFENTATPAGEYRDPQRDVPFALFVMIGSVTLLYTAVQLVALALVPEVARSTTPLADAAGLIAGSAGIWALTIGAAMSILGTNNNTVLAGSRYLYAMAERGRLPGFFAGVHPRYRTPWIALLTQTAIALPLALTGTFVELAALSVIARMATYIGTCAAVPVLRRRLPRGSFRLPGGPLVPIAAVLMCIAVLSTATARNLVAAAVALAVGAVIYALGREGTAA